MTDSTRRADETMIFQPGEISHTGHDRQGVITVIRGGGADLGKSMPVGASLEVGRAETCGLTLVDRLVSSRHVRIEHDGNGRYLLVDLGSTNGTRLNRKQLKDPVELLEGDKIFLGKTVLRFAMADAMDLTFHEELRQIVHTDPLTGLEAKHCFDDALEAAFAAAERARSELALMMIDMDGLKAINDRHGHLFGSFVIAETGRLLGRQIASRGRVCRFGGDEFIVMLPGLAKPEALHLGEELRHALEQAGLEKDGIPLHPTLSIGVASFPADGASVNALIDAADRALYRAKRAGKNRVCA